jgi:uncharacterized protein
MRGNEPPPWLSAAEDGVVLRLSVVPGASRAGVVGVHGTTLRVRVTARPVEGAANRALEKLIATLLGVRPSAVCVEAGASARQKRVRVVGVDARLVQERLAVPRSVDTGGGRH